MNGSFVLTVIRVKPRELLFFFAALLFSSTIDAEHKPLYSY